MHRLIEENLEEVLSSAGLPDSHPAREHLKSCEECSIEVGSMREQASLLRVLSGPADLEPRPGFYARVRERIEARTPVSVWDLFASSMFGRGLAAASLALVLALGALLVSTETTNTPESFATRSVVRETYPMLPAADFPDEVFAVPAMTQLAASGTHRGAVLVSLVTYQGR